MTSNRSLENPAQWTQHRVREAKTRALLALVPADDALMELPQTTMYVVCTAFGSTSAAQVLQLPDPVIFQHLREVPGCGPGEVSRIASWLKAQRERQGVVVSSSIDVRAQAQEWLESVRLDLARAAADAIKRSGLTAIEVARASGSSREVVEALVLKGRAPAGLETVVRLAMAVGVRPALSVPQTSHPQVETAPLG